MEKCIATSGHVQLMSQHLHGQDNSQRDNNDANDGVVDGGCACGGEESVDAREAIIKIRIVSDEGRVVVIVASHGDQRLGNLYNILA